MPAKTPNALALGALLNPYTPDGTFAQGLRGCQEIQGQVLNYKLQDSARLTIFLLVV